MEYTDRVTEIHTSEVISGDGFVLVALQTSPMQEPTL